MCLQTAGGGAFAAIFKKSCQFKQHSGMCCVYPIRAVEVKASRGEF